MTDYKAMYFDLFNKITDTIRILQEIQQETERAFIDNDSKTEVLHLLNKQDKVEK